MNRYLLAHSLNVALIAAPLLAAFVAAPSAGQVAKSDVAAEAPAFIVQFIPGDAHGQNKAVRSLRTDTTGDTVTVAPLLEDSDFFYPMTDPMVTELTSDNLVESFGTNFYGTGILEGNASYNEDGGGFQIDRVAVSASAAAVGGSEPWVQIGSTGDGGSTLTRWRFDVGAGQAFANKLMPDSAFVIVAARILLFSTTGFLAALDLGIDESGPDALSGIALIELDPISDIAGFDLSAIIIEWDITEAIFVGDFETGDLTRWSSSTR